MKHLTLDTSTIQNRHSLIEALNELIDYPQWHGEGMDAWIELISCYDRPGGLVGSSVINENFVIEVLHSLDFLDSRQARFREMMAIFAEVNRRYHESTGANLIKVVFSQ